MPPRGALAKKTSSTLRSKPSISIFIIRIGAPAKAESASSRGTQWIAGPAVPTPRKLCPPQLPVVLRWMARTSRRSEMPQRSAMTRSSKPFSPMLLTRER